MLQSPEKPAALSGGQLAEAVQALSERHAVPGASLAVLLEGQEFTCSVGVADTRSGNFVDEETRFEAGSVTKVVTATAVMAAIDQGLLELEQPIKSIIPGFANQTAPGGQDVTIRHLLTHTPGFDGDSFLDTGCGQDKLKDYVAGCSSNKLPWFGIPGEIWSYCNAGYVILGRILELTFEKPWEEIVCQSVFEPANVSGISFSTDQVTGKTATGHRFDATHRVSIPATGRLPAALAPAGSTLLATPFQLVRFASLFFDKPPHTDVALAPEIRSQMTQPQVDCGFLGDVDAWSFGWSLVNSRGKTVVKHSGHTVGQRTRLIVMPEGNLAVCVSCNGGDSAAFQDELCELILQPYGGFRPEPLNPWENCNPPDPACFGGSYRSLLHYLEIEAKGTTLVGVVYPADASKRAAQAQKLELEPYKNDIFRVRFADSKQCAFVDFFRPDEFGRRTAMRFGKRVLVRVHGIADK